MYNQPPKVQGRLEHLTPQAAATKALAIIEEERGGVQLGLYTEFPSLNRAMGKYFRFNTVNLWAGLSGHGKSYLLTLLTNNFLDYVNPDGINGKAPFVPIVIHFCFEMSAHNEILRAVAKDLGVNYNYLLSSQYDEATGGYNIISDEEILTITKALEYYYNKSILFFETPGNTVMIYNTVIHIVNSYKQKALENGLQYEFIINIDHTLLIDTLDEKSNLELMSNVGKLAIKLRKEVNGQINLLGQLNNNIEDVRRLTTPALHYPTKSDIYAQGQLYNACDNVFVIHQPMLLKISKYGPRMLDTAKLVHLIKLKARHGDVGNLWFENAFDKGTLIEFKKTTLKEEEQQTEEIGEPFAEDDIITNHL